MKENKVEKGKEAMRAYAKYSNLVLQVVLIVILGGWGGHELDGYMKMTFPVFTVVFVLLAAILGFYYMIKVLLKK